MTGLTWNEFKEMIDEQMKKKGIDENAVIWYIDISYPRKKIDQSDYKVPFVVLSQHVGLAIGE